jgi:hypothetical protein
VPKGIKMNSEIADLLKLALRKLNGSPAGQEITHMRGSEILIDNQLDLNDIFPVE